ncbi:hypothetical protein J4412_01420 [Candidatus Pacearchaeota archaeon]|nr:hypothetical protein [Candidatus Pacearchaeota archaeon]
MKEKNNLKYQKGDFIPLIGFFLYEYRTSNKEKEASQEFNQFIKGKFLIAYNVALVAGIYYGLEKMIQ